MLSWIVAAALAGVAAPVAMMKRKREERSREENPVSIWSLGVNTEEIQKVLEAAELRQRGWKLFESGTVAEGYRLLGAAK